MTRTRDIHFAFDAALVKHDGDKDLRQGLSVACWDGEALWLASDETAALERLEPVGEGRFGRHASYALADFFELPAGRRGEVDIEGVAADGEWIWVAGSHSLRRKQPRPTDSEALGMKRIATISRELNRYLLARLPRTMTRKRAAALRFNKTGNELLRALAQDEHLSPFLALPSKDNGLDVEGLAARDGRLYLGLRGPVLRGYAIILGVALVDGRRGELRLEAYAKHFLRLGGLGVRDLAAYGDDLLILAGPTMTLAGDTAIYRWKGGMLADTSKDSLVAPAALKEVLRIAPEDTTGAPEGLTVLDDKTLLVICDGGRKSGKSGAVAVAYSVTL